MGNHYNQLTLKERYQIQALNELGNSARQIAKELNRSNKTISEEIKRFGLNGYCAEKAHLQTDTRRKSAHKHCIYDRVIDTVDSLLAIDFSPEQIAGRIKQENRSIRVSRQTVYRLVERKLWRHRLPRKGKRYKPRPKSNAGVHLIPNRIDISERPEIVDTNTEIGHWEGDTVYGQNGYFVTLVERVTKVLLTRRVKNKTKQAVSRAVKNMLKPYRSICKTITFDNGGEFADHESIAKSLKCQIYFAKPYHSWQRGLNENTNGLLRRYFPKGMEIGSIPMSKIEQAVFAINIRPRKALNYLSPLEYLTGKRVSVIVGI